MVVGASIGATPGERRASTVPMTCKSLSSFNQYLESGKGGKVLTDDAEKRWLTAQKVPVRPAAKEPKNGEAQ